MFVFMLVAMLMVMLMVMLMSMLMVMRVCHVSRLRIVTRKEERDREL
tara:strand:+ start:13537 stop:13677 length:141 start_codon:yes stop_codon:yes gene_type:complete